MSEASKLPTGDEPIWHTIENLPNDRLYLVSFFCEWLDQLEEQGKPEGEFTVVHQAIRKDNFASWIDSWKDGVKASHDWELTVPDLGYSDELVAQVRQEPDVDEG